MQAALKKEDAGGVFVPCNRPIPLPTSILKREASLRTEDPEASQLLRSQVFSYRGRSCCVEAIYTLRLVVELAEPEVRRPTVSDSKAPEGST